MAMYDMKKELDFLKENGYSQETLQEKFELLLDTQVCNKSWKRKVEEEVRKVKESRKKENFRAAKNGNTKAYTEPFFTRSGDEWAVVARGIDFTEDGYGAVVVKVRRRDGSVGTVEVIDMVDRTSAEIKVWSIK